MTVSEASWFLYTAGVPRDCGYAWYPITAGARVADASNAYYAELGGCRPNERVGGEKPSLLLGRDPAGGWALFVGGLVPPEVPVGRWRRIHAVLLGVAPPGADVAVLLRVAVRALAGELEARLPVRWNAEQCPEIIGGARWPPAAVERAPAQLRDRERSRYYADAPQYLPKAAQQAGALLAATDLDAFPSSRPLILRGNLLDLEQCARIRPWLGVGGEQTTPKDLTVVPPAKEYKRRRKSEPYTAIVGPGSGPECEEGGRGEGEGGAAGDVGRGPLGRLRALSAYWAVAAGGAAAVAIVVVAVIVGSGHRGGAGSGSGVSASPKSSTLRATSSVRASPTPTASAASPSASATSSASSEAPGKVPAKASGKASAKLNDQARRPARLPRRSAG